MDDRANQNPGTELINLFLYSVIEAIIPLETIPLNEPERAKCAKTVTGFVQGQLQSLPVLLRAAFAAGMAAFRILVRMRYFSNFKNLSLDKRKKIVAGWAWGKVALARQLFRVVRSTALLAFYEIPAVKAALETPAASPKSAQAGSNEG